MRWIDSYRAVDRHIRVALYWTCLGNPRTIRIMATPGRRLRNPLQNGPQETGTTVAFEVYLVICNGLRRQRLMASSPTGSGTEVCGDGEIAGRRLVGGEFCHPAG